MAASDGSDLLAAFGRTPDPWLDFEPGRTRSAQGRLAAATANPLASWAALTMLRRGGSAVDAAIAAQAMLNVVEPNASGIGGGAMILVAEAGSVRAFDGISAAPARVTDRPSRDFDGRDVPAELLDFGGRTVCVPGAVRAMEMAHRTAGRLPWADLFAPAIEATEAGAPLSPYLARALREHPPIERERMAAELWYREGEPRPVGTRSRNPALAATLRMIAEQGPDAFYLGPIAERIVAAVAGDRLPGAMTSADLRSYRAFERRPVGFALGEWQVVAGPPPAFGGIAVGQILGIAARLGITCLEREISADALHVLAEASRLAQADRAVFGDPDDIRVMPEALLDAAYLDARAGLISPRRRAAAYPPGTLLQGTGLRVEETTPGSSMTSHIVVADETGQVVSMTTTINKNFGSMVSVGGFYLNDALTNFAAVPRAGGVKVPNAQRPGRRPRTTIAPCIVLDAAGHPMAAIGAGGGYRIIGFVANFLLRLAGGWHDPQAMLSAPHGLSWSGETEIEPELAHHQEELTARGHSVITRRLDGGAQALVVAGESVAAAGDPRRDGVGMASNLAAR
jgi:gamma-glutamyltranspeptidase / glutathione hydrolase